MTPRDLKNNNAKQMDEDLDLLRTFQNRYPELKYMPVTGPNDTFKDGSMLMSHPASHFIRKVKKYMKQGYNRYKAEEMVG